MTPVKSWRSQPGQFSALVDIAANRHDVTQLMPLIDAIPPIAGEVGAPLSKPREVIGDRGYDSDQHRARLHDKGIATLIARRRTEHGSGLGFLRWVVERSSSWLDQVRRLRLRYEMRADLHQAFVTLRCGMICWWLHSALC